MANQRIRSRTALVAASVRDVAPSCAGQSAPAGAVVARARHRLGRDTTSISSSASEARLEVGVVGTNPWLSHTVSRAIRTRATRMTHGTGRVRFARVATLPCERRLTTFGTEPLPIADRPSLGGRSPHVGHCRSSAACGGLTVFGKELRTADHCASIIVGTVRLFWLTPPTPTRAANRGSQ